MSKAAQWAARYIDALGFYIVPIEPGRKYPRANDWGNRALNSSDKAAEFFTGHPDWNMGVALNQSRLCSLDVDDLPSFEIICDSLGICLGELIASHPTIQGKPPGLRIMFRVPDGVELPYVKLNWRQESDPEGVEHKRLMRLANEAKKEGNTELEMQHRSDAKQFAMYTVFELRSATDGSQKQDVLPPSIHPETQKPYEWVTPPKDGIPDVPAWLITLWQKFDSNFKTQLQAACPWSTVEEIYNKRINNERKIYSTNGGLVAVADMYNKNNSIQNELERYGYRHVYKNRYVSPNSSTNLPGCVVLGNSNKVWIHHASDELCSDESGQPVSPFDLYRVYEHNGDFTKAAIAMGKQLNMRTDSPTQNIIPPPQPPQEMPVFWDDEPEPFLPDIIDEASQHIDTVTPLPWCKSNGKPYKTIDNLQEILSRMGSSVRYNVMRKEEEILLPGQSFTQDNAANAAFAFLTSICSLFDFAPDKNQEFLTYIADKNQYSPVVSWITSKQWDGVKRLDSFYDTVQTTDNALRDKLIYRWMLSAVAGSFSPNGVSAQGVLVFQGAQGMGKTRWIKSVVPDKLNKKTQMVADGILLQPDNKDSVKQVVSHWIVELGELDSTFKKSDQAMLKAFITRDQDTIRLPYARKESTFPRRTVFFGSVNPKEYLHDDTGNRRYWTLECLSVNPDHNLDMQQIWAEVYFDWVAGERHYLTQEENEMLNKSNSNFEAVDPITDLVTQEFDWESPEVNWKYSTITSALMDIGIQKPTRGDTMKASALIKKLNGDISRKTRKGREVLLPPRIFKVF